MEIVKYERDQIIVAKKNSIAVTLGLTLIASTLILGGIGWLVNKMTYVFFSAGLLAIGLVILYLKGKSEYLTLNAADKKAEILTSNIFGSNKSQLFSFDEISDIIVKTHPDNSKLGRIELLNSGKSIAVTEEWSDDLIGLEEISAKLRAYL